MEVLSVLNIIFVSVNTGIFFCCENYLLFAEHNMHARIQKIFPVGVRGIFMLAGGGGRGPRHIFANFTI